MTCDVRNCDLPPRYRGWCSMHYYRWYRLGEPGEAAPRYGQDRICTANDCDRPSIARRLCGMHYKRWQILNRSAKPADTKEEA